MWKDICGFEGYYQVNDCGEIRSLDRFVNGNNKQHKRLLKGKLMKLTKSNNGYFVVNLRKNGKSNVCCVHRIVVETFILNANNYETVNHKDGNKLNNNVSNLEWCDYSHNNQHALDNGLRKPRGNPIIQKDINGNILNIFESSYEAERHTQISFNNISHCLNNRTKTAGGFVWEKLL